MNDDLKAIIQKHNAKKLNSLSETTRRYLERYVWFEDKTNILVLSPRDSATGMRAWIAQREREKRQPFLAAQNACTGDVTSFAVTRSSFSSKI
jgi:hypothetical protein